MRRLRRFDLSLCPGKSPRLRTVHRTVAQGKKRKKTRDSGTKVVNHCCEMLMVSIVFSANLRNH
jgi:hypothetical protein